MATENASSWVVLLRAPRAEHPDPRGQGGWDVEDHLSGIDELLGQQVRSPPADSMAQVRSAKGSAQASSPTRSVERWRGP